MPLRLSVAMPTYNGERFVAQQIASIVTQSPPPDELVVSDDGSTDATLECVREAMAGSGVELRLVGGEHVGLRANVQRVLEACTGDVIVMSDQDDVWLPGRLAAIAGAFEDPAVTLWFSDAELIDTEGAEMNIRMWDVAHFRPANFATQRPLTRLLYGMTVTGATMAFRRTVLDVALPLPVTLERRTDLYLHDGWIAVLGSMLGTTTVEERPLTQYRQHDAQFTKQLGGDVNTAVAPISALRREHDRVELVWSRIEERTGASIDLRDRHTLDELRRLFATRIAAHGWRRSTSIVGHWMAGRYHRYLRGTRTAVSDLLPRHR